ncbi:hypothetical protein ANRL3_01805 [Anaerolineae bacterium]|nr:hypothetical protein ANRL3_01805 [Anaerolineae bacterium]
MLAERFVTRTDREGRLTGLPVFPANEEVEVIVLRDIPNPSKPHPYRLKPASLGLPSPGIDLDKALRLADELEDESLTRKLQR